MNKAIITAYVMLIFSASAYGQATMTAGSDTVAPGDTAVITMDATGDGTQVNISADLFYDDSLMTAQTDAPTNNVTGCLASLPSGIGGGLTSCRLIAPGIIRFSLSATDFVTPIPNAPAFGTISFDTVAGATPGTISPLDLVTVDTNPGDPSDLTSIDGAITFEAPGGAGFYASLPAPGGDLDLGAAVVNTTTAPAANLNVQNPSPDTDFDVTAISGDAQLNTPAGAPVPFGSNVDFPFDCTPTARGDQSGNFTVTHDAANGAASPVGYTFTCDGLSPNVAAAPLTVNLAGVIGQADPTDTFDVTNAQDGFASDATGAVLNEQAVAEISVTAGLADATISVDEVDPVTVSCSTAAPGMFTETLTLEYDDPVAPSGVGSIDIVVNCEIINEIPEYESAPAPGVALDFGQVLNGDTSPALGVDIGNTDTDTVPNGTLEVTGATITGPDAGVFNLTTDPTGTMIPADTGPDGVADAEVTCSPSDGFSTFTATLTISSNDPDGDVTYPLTCQGDNDVGLVSSPPPGDVNLGIIGPGMVAVSTITITNNGTTDSVSLSCTVPTGDPEITLVSPASFPVTIAPGASTEIVLNCAPTAPGAFNATLSCEATVPGGTIIPLDYDLSCVGQAVEVPTLSRIGLLAMIMALMAVGFIGFRLRQN